MTYTTVAGTLALGRSILASDFADIVDLTVNPVVKIVFGQTGDLVVVFSGPDIPQPVRRAVWRRIVTTDADQEAAQASIDAGTAAMDDWTPPTDPSAADLVPAIVLLINQVQAMTRRMTAPTDDDS